LPELDVPFSIADSELLQIATQSPELAFSVVLKFEDYASMITCYQSIEDEIEN